MPCRLTRRLSEGLVSIYALAFVLAFARKMAIRHRPGGQDQRRRSPTSVPSGFTTGQLAKIAAQILWVEAEHRTLGRDVAGATVPNDRILGTTPFDCVGTASSTAGDGTAVGALLPFVTGGAGFDAGHLLPDESAIREAAISSTINLLTNDIPGGLAGP